MAFQIGDLVRILKQPPDLLVHKVNEVGIIQAIYILNTQILTIDLFGSVTGSGPVPVDCLVPETRPQWIQAKQIYDSQAAELQTEAQARTTRIQAGLEAIAAKHGLSVDIIVQISNECVELYDSP